jgi:hypothetical protein
MHEAWHISEARRRHLLDQIDRPSKKMPSGKRNHYGAEDPQHQEFIFPRHGRPPTAIKRPGKPDGLRGGSERYVLGAGAAGFSAFGPLSPIIRTLLSSSDICMPESASKSAGTCAAILVMSPVSL